MDWRETMTAFDAAIVDGHLDDAEDWTHLGACFRVPMMKADSGGFIVLVFERVLGGWRFFGVEDLDIELS